VKQAEVIAASVFGLALASTAIPMPAITAAKSTRSVKPKARQASKLRPHEYPARGTQYGDTLPNQGRNIVTASTAAPAPASSSPPLSRSSLTEATLGE
jgi:hypothetical protein